MARTEQLQLEIELSNGKKAGKSLAELEKNARKLRTELRKTNENAADFDKKREAYQKAKKDVQDLRARVEGVNKANKQVSGSFGTLNKATGVLKKGFQLAVGALLPLFAFSKIVELGKHIFGLNDKYEELGGTIQKVSGLQGDALDQATIKVEALSNTFDKETKDITKSANALSKQMNISFEESLTIIEKGLLAGADVNDDFLNQISEYSTQFESAGASAEEFVAVLVSGEGQGVFNDKAADTFKEFNLRIREQTKPTKEALEKAFGSEFSKSLLEGINSGAISSVEAIKMVSQQMNETELSAEGLQTVVADVFGGAGEDAGLQYIQSLKDIDLNIDNLVDSTNDLTRRQQEQLKLEEELAAAQLEISEQLSGQGSLFKSLSLQVQTFATQGIGKVITFFQQLFAESKPIRDIFNEVGAEVGQLFSEVKKLIGGLFGLSDSGSLAKTIMSALTSVVKTLSVPIKLVVNLVTSLISGFIELNNKFEVVRGTIGALKSIFSNFFTNIKEGFISAFSGIGDILEGNFVEGIKKVVSGGLTTSFAAFKGIGEAAKEGYAEGVNNIITDPIEEETVKAEAAIEESTDKIVQKFSEQRDKIRQKKVESFAAEIAAQKAIEELRLSLVKDSLDKEIMQLQIAAEQKLETLKGTTEQQEEQRRLILLKLREETEQLIIADEQRRAEEEKNRLNERNNQKLEALTLSNQQEQNEIEDAALRAVRADEQAQLKRLELAREFEDAKLTLLVESGTATDLEIAQQNARVIEADKAFSDEKVAVRKAEAEKINAIAGGVAQAAAGFSELLNEIEFKNRKQKTAAIIAQKSFAISEIVINTGREIQGYLSNPASTATLGVLGGVLSGIAAARAAIQIRKIANTKETFAKGGPVKGPSHQSGGINMIDNQTGRSIGEMEGNELIMTKGVYRNPQLRAAASHINELGGGRRFQAGGPLNPLSTGTSQVNFSSSSQQENTNTSQEILDATLETNQQLITAINQQTDILNQWPTQLRVINDPRDTEDAINVLNEIEDSANV